MSRSFASSTGQNARISVERWLRRPSGRVRNWHDCCTMCNGQGHQ